MAKECLLKQGESNEKLLSESHGIRAEKALSYSDTAKKRAKEKGYGDRFTTDTKDEKTYPISKGRVTKQGKRLGFESYRRELKRKSGRTGGLPYSRGAEENLANNLVGEKNTLATLDKSILKSLEVSTSPIIYKAMLPREAAQAKGVRWSYQWP